MNIAEILGFGDRFLGHATGQRGIQSRRLDARLLRQLVDNSGIAQILAQRKMRGEKIATQLGEGGRLVTAHPLGSRQGSSGIR